MAQGTTDTVISIDLNELVSLDDLRIVTESTVSENDPPPAVISLKGLLGDLDIISDVTIKLEHPSNRDARIAKETGDTTHQRRIEWLIIRIALAITIGIALFSAGTLVFRGQAEAPWALPLLLSMVSGLLGALLTYLLRGRSAK